LQPYPIQKIDELTYAFITQNDIEYRCAFLSYAEYFKNHPDISPYFFSFNLELRNSHAKLPRGVDKRIADTVVTIVGNFLASKTNAVVYVCDNSDGKEAARSRKFLSWFDYYEHSSANIIQVSNNFKIGDLFIYSCLLVHKKNKLMSKMILAYLELTKEEDK
jgi:hypothetical protein